MKARDNKKFDRIITVSNEEKCVLLGALNRLFESDQYWAVQMPQEERQGISEIYNMLNF